MGAKKMMVLAGLLVLQSLRQSGAVENKKSLSPDQAVRAMGEVAAYQQFPAGFRLTKMGSVEAGETYFHIFATELTETNMYRTLVFSNAGNYLGYYQTRNEPVELDRSGIIFPGNSYNVESGDVEEGQFDSGDAHIIHFSTNGPPAEVKFETKTYTFVSSPNRVRPDTPGYRFVVVAERMANAMNRGRYKVIRKDFAPEARKRVSEEQTQTAFANLRRRLGKVERLAPPWVQSADTAMFPITFERSVQGLKIKLNAENQITGLWVQSYEKAFPEIGKNTTPIVLPFGGRWRVMWGGPTRKESKYYGNRTLRHSFEFVIADRFGNTYQGEGKRNDDYYAFGRPVLATAAGEVIAVIRGVEDSPPRAPHPFDQLGNTVMIRHSTNEVSVIGHLMQGSIVVKEGDTVEEHQRIGRCGNSGDSTQPSVYYHMQDSPLFLDGSGYDTVFSNIMVWDGNLAEVKKEYIPVRGEYVEQHAGRSEE